jgi:tRNA (cmo5U34)-methyltransferase
MKKNDFDAIAPIYDFLAAVVFGRSIKNSQLHFLHMIPANSQILIIGGGTGWLLPILLKMHTDVKITFIELSQKMISKAKKKLNPVQEKSVKFIHGDVSFILKNYNQHKSDEYSPGEKKYDVIITNFFLDVFNDNNLPEIFFKIKNTLRSDGLWFFTDFYYAPKKNNFFSWQKFLILFMYYFFKKVCHLEGSKLVNFDQYFATYNLISIKEAYYFHNMIKSSVFNNF